MSRITGSSMQGQRSNLKFQSSRDDLVHNRYKLSEPEGVFPLDSFPQQQQQDSITSNPYNNHRHQYPDFQPWEHSPKEDSIAVNHLQKGFFEAPHVTNELLSARNIMHQLLRSNTSLDELSSNILKAVDVRITNNKIGPSTYKPPPRVTLTDQKRESWLKDLANSEVPLRKLARTIPHGVRNKILLDQCVTKEIPINRAIWFVRCVGTNELRGLKRKGGANIEFNWMQDWTLQVVEYIEKLSLEYLKHESMSELDAMKNWKSKLSYMLRFGANLYMETLIDKESFKNWICRFFKNSRNFELPLSLTIIKLFWSDILKTDYLIKELTEALLIRYQQVSSMKNVLDSKDLNITDWKLNDQIKTKLLYSFKDLLIDSFNQSIDNFILPKTWNQLKSIIKSIINLNDPKVSKNFDHISYRNESLMINYSLDKRDNDKTLVQILDNTSLKYDLKSIIDTIFSDDWKLNLEMLIHWSITKFRDGNHRIYLVAELFKKFKTCQQVTTPKDIEQVLLDIIFSLKSHINVISQDHLFYLLNELAQLKYFKVSIYVRKVISSGLTYLTDNHVEKSLHASIFKNLKAGAGSQSSLVLKNLDPTCDELFKAKSEQEWNYGKQIIESALELGSIEYQSLQFLKSLPVGYKLKLSELLSKKLYTFIESGTPHNIASSCRIFDALGDHKTYFNYISKLSVQNSLAIEELEFVIEFLISSSRLTGLFTTFDNIAESFITNYNRYYMKYLDFNPFCTFLLEYVEEERLQIGLKKIMGTKQLQMDQVLIRDALEESNSHISSEDFCSISHFNNNFQILIRSLFNNNSNTESSTKISVLKLLKIMKRQNNSEFNKVLFVHIKKTYSSASELFRQEPILDLVVSRLISLDLIVDTFLSFNSVAYFNIVKDLLFRDFSELDDLNYMRFHYLRSQYFDHSHQSILVLLKNTLLESDPKSENIQSDSTDLLNDILSDQKSNTHRHDLLKIVLQYLVYQQQLVIKVFKVDEKECRSKFLSILNDALFSESITTSKTAILNDDISNLVNMINHLNDFNLPIYQLLFKLKMDVVKSNSQFIEFFTSLASNIQGDQSSIGPLFELVDDEMRTKFIHYLESSFLTSKNFPQISIGGADISLTLISNILIKLSKSLEKVKLPDQLVFSLDNSLELLLKIVNKSEYSTELYDAVSLFLRIIIIHKAFIIDIIVERNSIKETFLNNLVNLLTSKFISQNLQLKNLLYDLLLSIKSSVNEMNLNQTNNVKLPLSLLNLPAISENSSNVQNKPHIQNLHDETIVEYLYVYNKGSQSYNELNVKAFDLVEDSNPTQTLNDTAINLQLFETSIERKNPT